MFEEAFKNVLEGFKELLGKYKLEELEEIASSYCRDLETEHDYELCIEEILSDIQSMSEEEELVEEEEEV